MKNKNKYIVWQKEHVKKSKEMMKYNLRAACEKSKELNRPLTDKEIELFKLKPNIDYVPVKKLVLNKHKYIAVN